MAISGEARCGSIAFCCQMCRPFAAKAAEESRGTNGATRKISRNESAAADV